MIEIIVDSNSLRYILVDEALTMLNGMQINCAVRDEDTGTFSHDLKAFTDALGRRRQEDWYVRK